MRWFRRFVIGLAELCLVISMLIGTIAGAVSGRAWASLFALQFSDVEYRDKVVLFGTVLGAVVAFTIFAAITATIFTLTEIMKSGLATENMMRQLLAQN